MVEKWSDKVFKNPILNRIWDIFSGFMVWEIWKERNSQIFEGRTRRLEEAWTLIQNHTKEMLGLKQLGSSDLQAGPKEIGILRKWEITRILEYIGKKGETNPTGIIPEIWEPPPTSMYKLNFDGASKGNPSRVGYGGAIRNSEGKLVGLY